MKKISALVVTMFFLITSQKAEAQTEAMFFTSMGDFKVLLYDSIKPITAGNFISLTKAKFYDGVIFHRIIENFVIQGGDPTGKGTGGPGYSIADEFDSTLSNVVKTLSMANSGPNTGGSQFFINLVNNEFLDFNKSPLTSAHPVFGEVIGDWTLVKAISRVSVDGQNRPVTDVVMDSVRIVAPGFGLEELNLNHRIKLFPNPLAENSSLFFESTANAPLKLTVYGLDGKVIFEKDIMVASGRNTIALEELYSKNLASGVYQLALSQNGIFGYAAIVVK